MNFDRQAVGALKDLREYLKDGENSFALTIAGYIGAAVVYAILDVAQAVRELSRTRS